MNKRLQQIFFASAFGSFIGTCIAFQMYHTFWWIGMLVGGGVGYLTFDSGQVVRAVKNLSFSQEELGKFGRDAFVVFSMIGHMLIPFGVMVGTVFFLRSGGYSEDFITGVVFFVEFPFWIGALLISIKFLTTENVVLLRDWKGPLMWYNPLTALFLGLPILLFFFARAVPLLIRYLPSILRAIESFVTQVFIAIHSRARLVCMMDASLGTVIGYMSGSAFVGALAGGLIGVAHYYLISVKLLRLNETQ